MRRRLAIGLLVAVAPLGVATYASAKRMMMESDIGPPSFQMLGRPLGGTVAATATPASLAGSRIAAAGTGAIVIDADSGSLMRTDKDGGHVAELAIGKNAGLLAFDPASGLAYVADRTGDRLVAVHVADDGKLTFAHAWATPAEPYGVAITPDRRTILVTTIADRTLVAFDVDTGAERWRTELAHEPRNVAISPDGTRALVAYLATGTVDQIDLETHRAEHIALATNAVSRGCRSCEGEVKPFARAAFTVAFMGNHQAVVPFQRETPVQQKDGNERVGSYGGGGGREAPITHELAFLGIGDGRNSQVVAQIGQHQPRAIAWDGTHDALYVAGMGTDSILQIQHASTVSISAGLETVLGTGAAKCGPDGIAVAADGNVLVWCSFTRSVAQVSFVDGKGELATAANVTAGPQLVATAMSPKQHDGMILFASASPEISQRGGLACASCHPDVRADGLSWRIDKKELQTPLLAGRLVGTHPYKWDGGDKTLRDSLTSTMKRLGGMGLDKDRTDELVAYLESVPAVRTPTRDPAAVARGKELFDAPALGCRSCHDGKNYTDQSAHKFSGTLASSDTPSLIGLAASAPYFHDGSAATLEALLRDRGAVHGMADTAKLNDKQVSDLTAFLETL